MSKFYDEAYKWSLYEKYHNGFTLTELCEISGISDKSLHEWFKRFNYEYAQASVISLSTVRQSNARLKKAIRQRQLELALLQETGIEAIPEIVRILYAQRVLSRYGPNQVCRTFEIRKSNLYYHVFRKPELTAYEKHDQELRPAIQKICASSSKRIGAERIRQQLIKQGFTVGKKKVLQLLRGEHPKVCVKLLCGVE